MRTFFLKALLGLPYGGHAIRTIRYWRNRHTFSRFKTPEQLFTAYYAENEWADKESASGPGSTALYTEKIRAELPTLWARKGIHTLMDAPCGDYNWFRLIPRPDGPNYLGGDIVAPLVETNQTRYGNALTRFVTFDITKDELPDVDLWLCRDCLFHLSEKLVLDALKLFARSKVSWLLTSTHPKATINSDIPTGSFRLLNLQLPPYNLPVPEITIDDWIEGHPYRHLALWSRQAVCAALFGASQATSAEAA